MRLALTDRLVAGAKASAKARQIDYFDAQETGALSVALNVSERVCQTPQRTRRLR